MNQGPFNLTSILANGHFASDISFCAAIINAKKTSRPRLGQCRGWARKGRKARPAGVLSIADKVVLGNGEARRVGSERWNRLRELVEYAALKPIRPRHLRVRSPTLHTEKKEKV